MPDTSSPLAPLLGRTLVLAPHPDDEAVGCGTLMQRMRQPIVAFLTDGAPQSRYFWARHGTRRAYADFRRRESESALALIGIERSLSCEGVTDQELFHNLEHAQRWLDAAIENARPEALLATAFEGGHPDHDACSLLACIAGRRHALPVWEFPLYHRSVDGVVVNQQFREVNGSEIVIEPVAAEWDKKLRMFSEYGSQREVLQHFLAATERFRPLAEYDYTAPPHPGVLNYEAWQWGITGGELAAAFSAHLSSVGMSSENMSSANMSSANNEASVAGPERKR
ncbi:MAG: PIG-L family deacetylase [Acidobacteriota bacterium]|nr:PIG-L family deacetylase [Acidobacteriota bacterium]